MCSYSEFRPDSHIDVTTCFFEVEDQDYKYPDTYGDGCWKITKPRKEMDAMVEFSDNKTEISEDCTKWVDRGRINMVFAWEVF